MTPEDSIEMSRRHHQEELALLQRKGRELGPKRLKRVVGGGS